MALSCDYRIMAKGPYKIGLNETLLVSELNNNHFKIQLSIKSFMRTGHKSSVLV